VADMGLGPTIHVPGPTINVPGPKIHMPKESASVAFGDIVNQAMNAQLAPTGPAGPAQTPVTDPNAPFTLELPDAKAFDVSGPLQWSPEANRGGAATLIPGSPHYTVQDGKAGYDHEVRNYFMVRDKRIENLAAKLDKETGKALRDQLAQKIAIIQNSAEYRAADAATQAQILDKAYQDTEVTAISAGAVTADGKGQAGSADNATSLGYTPQDLAALQAVASQYLVPYAQQAQASGGMAQASLQSLASQAATPQMRVYATQAANAQKAAQDQLAAAYMAQVSAAPTMAVIQANTQLQQQMAQMQQQILGYQARSQQPASTGGDFASILAQAQAGGATTQAGG